MGQVAHQAVACLCGMTPLGTFLFPSGGYASPLQGYPLNSPLPIYRPGWGEELWELSVLPKNTTEFIQLGLKARLHDPELSVLTMTPPHLHKD